MKAKRKTAAERRAAQERQHGRRTEEYRPQFLAALESVNSWRAAVHFAQAACAPAPDTPERLFHTRLVHVLMGVSNGEVEFPTAASSAERDAYAALLVGLKSAPDLSPRAASALAGWRRSHGA